MEVFLDYDEFVDLTEDDIGDYYYENLAPYYDYFWEHIQGFAYVSLSYEGELQDSATKNRLYENFPFISIRDKTEEFISAAFSDLSEVEVKNLALNHINLLAQSLLELYSQTERIVEDGLVVVFIELIKQH